MTRLAVCLGLLLALGACGVDGLPLKPAAAASTSPAATSPAATSTVKTGIVGGS